MRTLSSSIKDALFTLNQTGIWTRLYEIVVDSTLTLFLTEHHEQVVFQENVYEPYPISIGSKEETSQPEMKSFTVSVANVDRTFITHLENGKILGNDITIILVFLDI